MEPKLLLTFVSKAPEAHATDSPICEGIALSQSLTGLSLLLCEPALY